MNIQKTDKILIEHIIEKIQKKYSNDEDLKNLLTLFKKILMNIVE